MDAYEKIEAMFNEIAILGEIAGQLSWDQETYMPEGANEARGEQMAYLSAKMHKIVVSDELKALIEEAEKLKNLDEWQASNLAIIAKERIHAAGIKTELVEELNKACSASGMAWRKAKPGNNFKSWLPHFEKVLTLTKEMANIKSDILGVSPYDTLLDSYQPGMLQANIDPVFYELKAFLPDFINKIKGKYTKECKFNETYSNEKLDKFVRCMAETVGFDFNHGRIDTSAHGFCNGAMDDVRITYTSKNSPIKMAKTIIHESGHALYSMNMPKKWKRQPVGSYVGMGAHESQSLFFEYQVAHDERFISYLTNEMKAAFSFDEITYDNVLCALRQVKPSFIRVDADEVTYPLHVIMRYEIEKELINGELQAHDVPVRWAEKMQEFFALTPPSDTEGCMQDIHWPQGMIGYFPSYTIGAVTAAQLKHTMEVQNPNIMDGLESGDLSAVRVWLADNMHSLGALLPLPKLVKKITGNELSASYFIQHLKNRYG